MDFKKSLAASIETKESILADAQSMNKLEEMANVLISSYASGGKLLVGGNGGSAADAQHFATEITCQFIHRRKAHSAVALHTDSSALTAWSNDYDYESFFARLVEAHGAPGDVLVVISTSGNSKNLIAAAVAAHGFGMKVLGLLGRDGGKLHTHCDLSIIVPSASTPRIQECHITLIHLLCEALDDYFHATDNIG